LDIAKKARKGDLVKVIGKMEMQIGKGLMKSRGWILRKESGK